MISPEVTEHERKLDLYFGPYNRSIIYNDCLDFTEDNANVINASPKSKLKTLERSHNWRAIQSKYFQSNLHSLISCFYHTELPGLCRIHMPKRCKVVQRELREYLQRNTF